MNKYLNNFMWLIIWCFFSIIDLVVAIFSPNSTFHKSTNDIYHKHVKPLLTGNRMSRTSYTFAHGFFLFLLLCALLVYVHYNIFDMDNKFIKNKFIKVSVHSPTNDSIRFFNMNLMQDCELTDTMLLRDFSFFFKIDGVKKDSTEKDTATFVVSITSNFDSSFSSDTTGAISLSEQKYSPMETSFKTSFIKVKDEENRIPAQIFFAKSKARIFNDKAFPYVNFYLSIDKSSGSALAIDEEKASKGDYGFHIWLNNKYDSLMLGYMPYDVISVKPEPDTFNPYYINYSTPEKVEEVLKKGIYISVVNRDLKNELDKSSFLRSVWIGALVSFILSVIIIILTKWRNLSRSSGRQNPYN